MSATIDRSGWKRVRLGDIAGDIRTGKRNGNEHITNGKYPFFIRSQEVQRINSYSYDGEAILIPGEGGIGNIFHYIKGRFDFHQRVYKVSSFSREVNAKFLFYCMQRNFGPWALSQTSKAAVDSIRMATLQQFELALPPMTVQNKIYTALTSIDTHISALQSLIAKYEAIKKATVNLVLKPKVAWRQISLGDIGDVLMCKRILKNQTTKTGDVPFYKIGTFGRTPDSFISRALFEDFKARFAYPQKGDVLLSAAGTIGRTVVFNGEDAYFQDSNIVWIDNDERAVTNRFLNVLYGQMNWQTENGGTVSRLYNANIRNTKIKIPSLSEQKRIVAILDSIDGTINGLKSQLAKAQDIKQGMMSYFFG